MTAENEIRQALIDELKRQAEIAPDRLKVGTAGDKLTLDGQVDVDALVMVVMGSLAGGP
ncbi:hypothetical protein GCM10007276_34030 [Agaricicola taiwanensis]|uniref:Uncharacterized protein n=1 Tax=Agaricicola taiwanensis TaxID=591372 RepID=A0A8J3E1J2_9RHOB|nr:hypothetical protein [Agaricicola taiwanensis]GGE54140.1 hypothetical protein GCM10007276_34030 [Agaricicola taiwanensis]